MSAPELSRLIRTRPLPGDTVVVEASEAERAALAARFGLSAIESLRSEIELEDKGKAIRATGHLNAKIVQVCAISAEDFPVAISEAVDLRFVPEGAPVAADEEIELEADDCDEIEYSGDMFDLGEAVAQTLGLAIDPYAEGPNADAAREKADIKGDDTPSGPLAEALAALKKD